MSVSPTSRTLSYLRDQGYSAQVAEKFISFINKRIDLFGFIDVVGIRSDLPGILGVQVTTNSNLAARITKTKQIPEAKIWLQAGNRIEFHGWSKKGAKGTRKLWKVRVKELTLEDFGGDENG